MVFATIILRLLPKLQRESAEKAEVTDGTQSEHKKPVMGITGLFFRKFVFMAAVGAGFAVKIGF